MGIYLGIDPGLSGAVAVVNGQTISVWPTPTTKAKKGTAYNLPAMVELLNIDNVSLVVVEHVHAMPRQGVVSMFNFGRGFGLWEGLLAGRLLPYMLVSPQAWQKAILGGNRDPNERRIAAMRLFPGLDLGRKVDSGRADALLLAVYAERLVSNG